ncbi:MAG: AAA family ATPase [bacterium]|nr:AAA family ATPase [bacterium]
MAEVDSLERARKLPAGARFYKCALQVNPFGYLIRHHKATPFTDEHSYNEAMVAALRANGIEVIAITDHFQVTTASGLAEMAEQAGIVVFPGFEAVTKEGVHFLCLFDPGRGAGTLERIIGDCGIHETRSESPISDYDALELLARSRESWQAVCVAAHVAADGGGLLRVLKGTSRINVWTSPHLLACALPGSIADAPENLRPILQNKNAQYRRDHRVAVIHAQDVSDPDDLAGPGAACWIKMSEVSVEGLRQAFLDSESRIRLDGGETHEHVELVAVGWQSGFLDEQAIHFNKNLNVLIGGRGAGKSTVVESLRYALDIEPFGEEARKAHQGIVRQVLRNGTKISVLVRSFRPAQRDYRIDRTVPNPPVVRDQEGQVLKLTPKDIVPNAEVFGQHEISELAQRPEKLTMLLGRFVERDPALNRRKSELRAELKRSRIRLLQLGDEIRDIDERLDALPNLEETLRRFQEAGLEDRLKEKSLLIREERVLKTIPERIAPFRELLDQLRSELPIDCTFLSPEALAELPGGGILAQANAVLGGLGQEMQTLADRMATAIAAADQDVEDVGRQWDGRKRSVEATYEKILRELQKSNVDGEEFIRLRRQIEELRPLRERRTVLGRDLAELEQRRRNLLAEWEDAKGAEFREIERAAKKVGRQLAGRVRARINFAGNRQPLFALLQDQVGGRLSEAIKVLGERQDLSVRDLAEAMREGANVLQRKFGLTPAQAARLAAAEARVIMQIEELDLAATTRIELNLAGGDQPEAWQELDRLSKGQKATAVLLLLLLQSDAPLIIDQPEDDLDNRFITEGIVPKMRDEKQRRQFIFTTHNANIPVLGDAELIVGLRAAGEAEGNAELPAEHMGSLDSPAVRDLVEELLEGGKAAFETRRLKYGF